MVKTLFYAVLECLKQHNQCLKQKKKEWNYEQIVYSRENTRWF